MAPNGDGPVDHPALKDVDLDAYLKKAGLPRLGNPSRGHPLLTKTLLFVSEGAMGRGAGSGAEGGVANFRAYDKATGDLVMEMALPQGPSGTPMTYAISGRQYIVVPTGGIREPSKFYALALPESALAD